MLEGKIIQLSTGSGFDTLPMDKYTVQCIDVNLVKQQKFQSNEEEDVLNYQFVVLDNKTLPKKEGETEEKSTRGKYLWKRCRLALNDRSWLGKLAKAAFGRDLAKGEIETFDVEAIVGKQIDVMVEEVTKNEKTYNNIVSFNKVAKELEPIDPEKLKKSQTIEKTTVPVTAPASPREEVDNFIGDMEKENKQVEHDVEPKSEVKDEVADLEEKLAAAKAKKKTEAKE